MYPLARVPEQYQWIFKINPAYYLVKGYRAALLGREAVDLKEFFIFAGLAVFMFLLGGWVFRKLKPWFADEL